MCSLQAKIDREQAEGERKAGVRRQEEDAAAMDEALAGALGTAAKAASQVAKKLLGLMALIIDCPVVRELGSFTRGLGATVQDYHV